MNDIERRALYHLLRMNWLNEPSLSVEPWQVEDYRSLALSDLFDQLQRFKIQLNRLSFVAYADECGSPEELTEHLIGDRSLSAKEEDQIYLLIFELWRRLMSEKPSLSIVCNEFDYQIYLYDHQKIEDFFDLQDAITNFLKILDENVDEGIPPQQAFKLICTYCANDIEIFLYDFIANQIDEENDSYAHELLGNFDAYLGHDKWFKLLRLRLCENNHSKNAQKIIGEIIEEYLNEQDVDYNLEFLSVLTEIDDSFTFRTILKNSLPLIRIEENFQELLTIAIDHFHHFNQEAEATTLQTLLNKRAHYPLHENLHMHNPDFIKFIHLFHLEDL